MLYELAKSRRFHLVIITAVVACFFFFRVYDFAPCVLGGGSEVSAFGPILEGGARSPQIYDPVGEILNPADSFGTRAAAEKDGIAYRLTRNGELHVYDISNLPSQNTFTSYSTPLISMTLKNGAGLFRNGDYLYAFGNEGLEVIDIHAPAQPVFVRAYQDLVIRNLTRDGDYLAAPGEEGIVLYKLTNPANPELVSVYRSPGSLFFAAAMTGDTLYASALSETDFQPLGLSILSLKDPTSPTIVRTVPEMDVAYHLRVLGKSLIESASGYLGLWDITDPRAPGFQSSAPVSGRVCAIDGENVVTNGQVLRPSSGAFTVIASFTPGGAQRDGFPFGSAVNANFVFLAQSQRVLILKRQ